MCRKIQPHISSFMQLVVYLVSKNFHAMNRSILIYHDGLSPRIEYIMSHVLGSLLGLRITFTRNEQEAIACNGALLSYSNVPVGNSVHIVPHPLLRESGVREQRIEVFHWHGLPTIFHGSNGGTIPFDLFAATFYLITRYEEYLPFVADEHGRFPSAGSIAHTNGFLEIPLVDMWVRELGEMLSQRFPDTLIRQRGFSCIPTIDIDNAYAYLHKGIIRSVGSTLSALVRFRWSDLALRIPVYTGQQPDPFDTHSRIFEILRGHPQSIFFILGGQYGLFDKHIPVESKPMRKLIGEISARFAVGLHPSYQSWLSRERVAEELGLLTAVAGKPVVKCRQHFIRLSLPHSYRILADLGIKSDYSMGYTERVGFRASTSTPFPFYDLLDERVLPITIIPFQVMDVTLRQHMGLNPTQAVAKCTALAKSIEEVGGTFIPIWHNESLSGVGNWRGWDDVLPEILRGITGF